MLKNNQLPNLKFPMVSLGVNETPWDLTSLLYFGAASIRVNLVGQEIQSGLMGEALQQRIALVQELHEVISAALTGGGSKQTARVQIEGVRRFFSWAEKSGRELTLGTVASTYMHWADHLDHRVKIKKDLKNISAYRQARVIGGLLDNVLERPCPIVCNTSLKGAHKYPRAVRVEADKQNLSESFEFGHFLADVCDGTSLSVIRGPIPIKIQLRRGGEIVEWCGLSEMNLLAAQKMQMTPDQKYEFKKKMKRREALTDDSVVEKRATVINTRVEAELLMFIAQTGKNLTQAQQLKLCNFRYKSTIDGYEVRDYKNRRQGEVIFEIFSEYKEIFERYLAWRKSVFGVEAGDYLFRFANSRGRMADERHKFWRIRGHCRELGIRFISPRVLRRTRINWLLRRSRDPDLTAEIAQHTKQTLFEHYEEPNLQVAISEVARFWSEIETGMPATGPGVCDGVPTPVADIPEVVLPPDCIHPSGCLWCEHNHDIDSLDHVWNLVSMRYMKIIALGGFVPSRKVISKGAGAHIQMTVDRLTSKIRWFDNSNATRRSWVVESLSRIDEGCYHPHWECLIYSMESSHS